MRILNTLIFIALSLSLFSQDIFEQQYKNVILQQQIKSITQLNYQIKDGKPSDEGYKNSYQQYDQRGNLTEEIKYKSNGDIFLMMSYRYDERNNQVGYVRYDGKDKKVTYKKVCKYNDDNQLMIEAGFDGASQYKNVYNYDEQGRLTEIKYYTNDHLMQLRSFEYEGATCEIRVTDRSGKHLFKLIHKYDGKGNLINQTRVEPDGTIYSKISKTFNEEGNVLSEIKYERGNFRYKITRQYNNAGDLMLVEEEKPNGTTFIKQKYTYNSHGVLLKEEFRKKSTADYSYKQYNYNTDNICKSIESFFASYNYKVLFKMVYEYF